MKNRSLTPICRKSEPDPDFPQAFPHVALINTAMNLGEKRKPVEQRAEEKAA